MAAKHMVDELVDVMTSLAAIMTEETALLRTGVGRRELAALSAAKVRLGSLLETAVAKSSRQGPDWIEALEPEERAALLGTIKLVRDVAEPNARMLERQIDLSTELMLAVASEAQRLSGKRNSTYGASGLLSLTETATPISINTNL
jgi:hypothetical protein